MAKKVKDAIDKGAKRAKDAPDKAAAATKKATDRAAKAAKDATDRAAKGAKSAADRVEGVGASIRKSGEKLAKQGNSISMKVIEHAEANTREAFAAMRKAAGAKSPAEVAKIQGEYLRDQGARALAHAREIGDLIMQFGRDATGAGKK
ncbi:phasin family protein [Sphingomonas bacterium]|uniref:phasin family protein n=1 Tax=Sphingomonas bacterium TaxID=1895847 RepID=UPI0026330C4D|nr:phasin family protein [Sphingomonas bacterium]MDB5677250.1 phasin family protein [Sphingomonas bacterium]